VKVKAYVPTLEYTRHLPEFTMIYATPEAALRGAEILWERRARYLIVVEAELDHPFSPHYFAKYGKEFCRRDNLRVVKVRAARP